ncbi:MAG: hypothetical protein PVJ15_05885 [Gammaproteobacteria bacterium]
MIHHVNDHYRLREGAVHRLARVLKDCNWASLAEKLAAHDRRKTG